MGRLKLGIDVLSRPGSFDANDWVVTDLNVPFLGRLLDRCDSASDSITRVSSHVMPPACVMSRFVRKSTARGM